MTHRPVYRQVSPLVFFMSNILATSFDFKIVSTNIAGISSIEPQNEDALDYLVNEAHMTVFTDGSAALFDDRLGDFISDAGWAHFSSQLV